MLDDRLVCLYLDDSGQQSKGRFFVVAGIAIERDRAAISSTLCRVETISRKHLRDWHRTNAERRIAYLTSACSISALQGRVFYKIYANCADTNQMQLRADAVQDAIAIFAHHSRRAIYYEGLTRASRESLEHGLRRCGLKCEVRNGSFAKVPEVRLVDSLAGMIAKVKFSPDGSDYTHLIDNSFVEL